MRERVDQIVGFGAESIWVSTFHSTCVQDSEAIHRSCSAMTTSFTIYDTDDQKTLMKDSLQICWQIDTKVYKERNAV